MSPAEQQARELHDTFCRVTRQALPYDMGRESAWFAWIRKGLTPGDLVKLIKHHQRERSEGRPARSLLFRSIVVNVDWAIEDLAAIRANERVQRPDKGLAEAMQATGRPAGAPASTPALRAGEALRGVLSREETRERLKALQASISAAGLPGRDRDGAKEGAAR